MAKDDHLRGEQAEQERVYLLKARGGADIIAGQANDVGAGKGRDSAWGLHAGIQDNVAVIVGQRNQKGNILIDSRGGAVAALDVEYDEVVGQMRGIEVRVRLAGGEGSVWGREERDMDGKGHSHHWGGGTTGERLEMGKQLGLDELLEAAERRRA